MPSPDCYLREPGESWADHARRSFAAMEAALEQHASEIAAVIVEPLVQCAGGMRMYDPVYLQLLRAACDRIGVHLIADEIAVGFGRTGTLFACEQADIRPDFMCLSKGLTGGYLPLSVVLTTESIYTAFYDDYVTLQRLPALAQLHRQCAGLRGGARHARYLRQEPVLERNRALAANMARARSRRLADHPHVAEVRQRGMISPSRWCGIARQPRTLSLAGTSRPERLPACPVARRAAAAHRQCDVLHAALRHHARGDRPDGGRVAREGDCERRPTCALNRVHAQRPDPRTRARRAELRWHRRQSCICCACCACAPARR